MAYASQKSDEIDLMLQGQGLEGEEFEEEYDRLTNALPSFYEIPKDEQVGFLMENLDSAHLPTNEEGYRERRERFVQENVEGPCRKMALFLMEQGMIKVGSNAFNDSVSKGVFWIHPDDLQGTEYNNVQQKYLWHCKRQIRTDLQGRSFSESKPLDINSEFPNDDLNFSNAVPSSQDFQNWINAHDGPAERPDGFDETDVPDLRFDNCDTCLA